MRGRAPEGPGFDAAPLGLPRPQLPPRPASTLNSACAAALVAHCCGPACSSRCRPVVEHTSGICRIVPPPEWVAGVAEEFAIDRSSLKFTARVQRVDQLQRKHTAVASQRFWNEYNAWMAANGIKRKGKGGKVNPVFNGQEVELDRLHAVVTRRGGYTAVTEDRSWREIANVLDVSVPCMKA